VCDINLLNGIRQVKPATKHQKELAGYRILEHTYIARRTSHILYHSWGVYRSTCTGWAIYTQPSHMQEVMGDGPVTILKGAKGD
jgi:hypothetical protein